MKTFMHRDEREGDLWYVYRQNNNSLYSSHRRIYSPGRGRLVGTFKSDSLCDWIMNMIRVNEEQNNCDPYWTKKAQYIARNGI